MAKEKEVIFATPACIISFPELFHRAPTSKQGRKQDPKKWRYQGSFLFGPDDKGWEEIHEEVNRLKKKLKNKYDHCCLESPEEHDKKYQGYPGNWVLKTKADNPKPGVFGLQKGEDGKWLELTEDEARAYPGLFCGGAIVRASVSFFTYNNETVGIGANLKNVQVLAQGTPFGGGIGSDPNEDFDDEVASEFEEATSGLLD